MQPQNWQNLNLPDPLTWQSQEWPSEWITPDRSCGFTRHVYRDLWVHLRFDFADDLPPVEIDVAQIRQVAVNLVTNASEAVGENGGLITVRTGELYLSGEFHQSYYGQDMPEGRYVFLEVVDTGCGMDSATQTRIFEPFFSTKFPGRGLGLAAVMGMVRGNGGGIRLYSEPDVGTTCKVLLPCKGGMPILAETEIRQSLDVWQGEGTILVVDDEPMVRRVARTILTRAGLDVLMAMDGEEGVELFAQHAERIDAVLLDMTMPRKDGRQTFAEMREIDPEAKVILTSGYSEADATSKFLGQVLAGFIQKPFQRETLLAKLYDVLHSHAVR